MNWSKLESRPLNPHPTPADPAITGPTPAIPVPVRSTSKPTPASAYRLRGNVGGSLRVFPLTSTVTTVGSHRSNDLVLPGVGVSKRHAILHITHEGVTVEDRGSKNGTWINGRRTARAKVHVGDEIGLGTVALELAGAHPEDACLAISFEKDAPSRSWSYSGRESRETEMVTEGGGEVKPRSSSSSTPKIRFPEGHIVGHSPEIQTLYRDLETAAAGPYPALILGETGSGKEMISRAVHESSARCGGPFVAVNCAAIPADLMEAEMFGVVKGAATGVDPRPGCFVRADGGTLFLDEVGEIHADLQAKLLRALEYGEVQPVGGKPAKVDVRIVSATNVDLERQIVEQGFRADLYYRLAASVLTIPPLRERREDLPILIQGLIERITKELGHPLRGVTQRALDVLTSYPWPGNVRELQHELRRAVQKTAPRQALDSSVLSSKIREAERHRSGTNESPAPQPDMGNPTIAQRFDGPRDSESGPAAQPIHDLSIHEPARPESPGPGSAGPAARPEHWNLKDHVAEVERRIIAAALVETQNNRTLAAQLLQISRNTLATKIALYGLT